MELSSFNKDLYNSRSRRLYSTSKSSETMFYVPRSLTSIGEMAFNGTDFKHIKYQEGSSAKVIDDFSFYGSNVVEIELPQDITELGTSAFSYTMLVTFTVPQKTITINKECFSNCIALKNFTILSDCELATIGDSPFMSCPSLVVIICQSSKFTVANEALYDNGLTKLIAYPPASPQYIFALPKSITMISAGAFYGASYLESVQIPDGSLEIIGESAFENCKHLKIISIPSSVTTIGSNAFRGCKQIQCGQIVTLSEEKKISLVTNGQFPRRGLRPCGPITCEKRHIHINQNVLLETAIFIIFS